MPPSPISSPLGSSLWNRITGSGLKTLKSNVFGSAAKTVKNPGVASAETLESAMPYGYKTLFNQRNLSIGDDIVAKYDPNQLVQTRVMPKHDVKLTAAGPVYNEAAMAKHFGKKDFSSAMQHSLKTEAEKISRKSIEDIAMEAEAVSNTRKSVAKGVAGIGLLGMAGYTYLRPHGDSADSSYFKTVDRADLS